MRKFYYYARLNDNNVCTEIISRTSRLIDVQGYIEIPEYNETLVYRKWLGDQWSQESYEPEIDTVIQDKIEQLEIENANLQVDVDSLSNNIVLLEGTITELMSMLATIGGAK